MINFLKETFLNIDYSIKKLVKRGAVFSFNILFIATLVLFVYVTFYSSPFLYTIGILVFKMGITYLSAFLACGFAFNTIKNH